MNDLPLRDIHLPDPISWWPLAYGWWLLLVAVLLFVILGYRILRKLLRPTLRKEAARALEAIEKQFNETENAALCVTELSEFLRRVILSENSSVKAAGVTGVAWLELLDKNLDQPEFSRGAGRLLIAGPYQKQVDKEGVSDLIELCKKWVKRL